jgi:hypothetical protein
MKKPSARKAPKTKGKRGGARKGAGRKPKPKKSKDAENSKPQTRKQVRAEKLAMLLTEQTNQARKFAKLALKRSAVIVDRTCVTCQAAFKYDHLSRGRYRKTCSGGTSKDKSKPYKSRRAPVVKVTPETAPAVRPKSCSNTTKTDAPRPSVSGKRLAPANHEA